MDSGVLYRLMWQCNGAEARQNIEVNFLSTVPEARVGLERSRVVMKGRNAVRKARIRLGRARSNLGHCFVESVTIKTNLF